MTTHTITGFPINLLIQGRPCLVVGAGKVAYHKVSLLLEAGAKVTVVSPTVCDPMQQLIEQGRIYNVVKTFEPSDVVGMTIVFAATNCKPINHNVLEACRPHNILCCCADGNWTKSDFTTPAITRNNGLTVSVSSNGRDCRQSKMVKNLLARHLKAISSAELIVVGTDHNRLTVDEREPYHLTGPHYERTGFMVMQLWGIHEFMIVNTCNRVELIAVVSKETAENGILRHVLGFTKLKEDKYYLKRGIKAFEHICLVTSGMLSQTPGENHIAAQIKEALCESTGRGWASNMIQEWISNALHISKQIKNTISPLLHSCEIEDLAFNYLNAKIPDLKQCTLMILGAGMVGKGLITDAAKHAKQIIWCYHINRPEIPEHLADQVKLCTFNTMKDYITEADVIISATDAPGHILHLGHAPFFNQEKPVHLIDLAMPRNIDPELDTLSSDISVADLEALKYWHRREQTDMDDILSRSRTIVRNNKARYEKIANSFDQKNV